MKSPQRFWHKTADECINRPAGTLRLFGWDFYLLNDAQHRTWSHFLKTFNYSGWVASLRFKPELQIKVYWGISCNHGFCFKARFSGSSYSLYAELAPWSYLHTVTRDKFGNLDPLLNKTRIIFTYNKATNKVICCGWFFFLYKCNIFFRQTGRIIIPKKRALTFIVSLWCHTAPIKNWC